METSEHHLREILDKIKGLTEAQLTYYNQWAAVALDRYHMNSNAKYIFNIDGNGIQCPLSWDSDFSKEGMKEKTDMAHFGGISLAFFVMCVLLDFSHVQQSEIGEGVDYRFQKSNPNEDNFFSNSHYIEISGLLEEYKTNTLNNRIKGKHQQIDKGTRREEASSIIVTLFANPITIKEIHK